MNKIVFAGKNADGEHENKYLEIIINGSTVIVAPPYCGYRAAGADFLRVFIEQPVTPLKDFVSFKDEGGMIELAARQAQEFLKRGNGEAVLQAFGNLLIAYVNFYADKPKYSPAVQIVREDILKNVSNAGYALDDFIKKLPLNYDYVRKLFRKEVGATPREYLEGLRMELAANILSSGISNKYSKYSVSQVAEACGFAEPLYFSRVFKKRYGVSPALFKQGLDGEG